MTREEAIRQLDGADIAVLNRDFFKFNQAIIMAISALRQQEHFREVTKKVEPLTLDELIKRDDPVFVSIKDFPNGGYWCLCQNGYIIPPSGYGFMAKERPNWAFYSQKPEDADHDERKENEHV